MPHYRLYKLNGLDRITAPAIEIIAGDDAEALQVATALRHIHAVEIWCGARLADRTNVEL